MMSRRIRNAQWILVLTCFAASRQGYAGDLVDRVVASINTSVITQLQLDQRVDDLNRVLSNPKSKTKGQVPPLPVLRRLALDSLMEDELALQHLKEDLNRDAAERYATRIVDEQIDQLKKNLGEDQFLAKLTEENQSLSEFREALIADRTHQVLVDNAKRAWIDEFMLTPVSQAQVDKYLEDHPEALEEGGAPEVQFVFLRVPPQVEPSGEEAIRAKAEKILAKARVGGSFEELVSRYSQHEQSKSRKGFLDLISPTVPYPEFGPLFEAEAGQVYPQVLKIPGWFCVAKVKSKQSLYNVVRRKIAQEEQAKAMADLRNEAIIVYDKELFPSSEP